MTAKFNELCRRALAGGGLAAALLAASCGGGEQVRTFSADRIVAFGDESSLIVDTGDTGNGSKYSVNGVFSSSDPRVNCEFNALWIQNVAANYGLVFPQCNRATPPVAAPSSRIRATFGARVADLAAQIDAQQADSPLGSGDMVTVLVGANDVFAQYAQYPTQSEAQIVDTLNQAGRQLGLQVNRLADTGAKVLISTIIDTGRTPFAMTEKAAHADTDRATLLTRLARAFNGGLRASIRNDGRSIGLVQLDELVTQIGAYDGLEGFNNSTLGACDLSKSMLVPPSILDCTDLTLTTDASGRSYLWADDRHLSAGGQASLGSLARSRADNNPF